MRLTPRQVVDMWRAVSTRIPAQFALGSALHETGYNPGEVDAGDQGDGTDSIGLYQISRAEAITAGRPAADLLDPAENTLVFAGMMEKNLDDLIVFIKKQETLDVDHVPPDIWAYLALSHNQGIGAARVTIAKHGLDWDDYAKRNVAMHPKWIAYYGDCITGGKDWDPSF